MASLSSKRHISFLKQLLIQTVLSDNLIRLDTNAIGISASLNSVVYIMVYRHFQSKYIPTYRYFYCNIQVIPNILEFLG